MKYLLATAALTAAFTGLIQPANASENGSHWGYGNHNGPKVWGTLSPEYRTCHQGRMQSPIDLHSANASGYIDIKESYKSVRLSVTNTGHSLQIPVGNSSFISIQGKVFFLKQLHFHTPSEHVENGKPFPLEAHFVHQAKTGELSVIAVLFKEGSTNPQLDKVIELAPRQTGATLSSEQKFNPEVLLPKQLRSYRYMGSLTTPPCSEGVNWFVLKDALEASPQQIEALNAAIGPNARPVQPIHDRLVLEPLS